jgi:hypothetical protein
MTVGRSRRSGGIVQFRVSLPRRSKTATDMIGNKWQLDSIIARRPVPHCPRGGKKRPQLRSSAEAVSALRYFALGQPLTRRRVGDHHKVTTNRGRLFSRHVELTPNDEKSFGRMLKFRHGCVITPMPR